MELVERIRELCGQKNTNFAALERELGFGQGTIRKWDASSPSGDKLDKVADYFDVSVDYLLGRIDVPYPVESMTVGLSSPVGYSELNEDERAEIDEIVAIYAKRKYKREHQQKKD
ncbi:MAG: helix-turn-helix transcriptional regulator [Christensenella sp.]|uniref:helix-turn-helix domain-containing protein n=1 Tax=Christensenella sp. TaxID=1935934 RepID=UPI002B21AD4D|nr:helix-turn-helix transcriptional regulator [Christensenella sp.]MEA5002485.1 helix-turn-helix transcriptional regulator [Christensenella sp.]